MPILGRKGGAIRALNANVQASCPVVDPGSEEQNGCVTFFCFGVRVVVSAEPSLLKYVPLSLLPQSPIFRAALQDVHFLLRKVTSGDREVSYELWDEHRRLETMQSLSDAIHMVETHAREAVAIRAPGLVFIHAGVVGWKGQAILIPGRSFSGKTTLVMALVELGATYYSDEYAVLDQNGFVHPYWREPRLRTDMGRAIEKEENSMPAIGAEAPPPLPVGMVLVSEYRAEGQWCPTRLTCGEALFSLIKNTVAIQAQPEASMRALRNLAVHVRSYKTVRGEAALAAPSVLKLMRPQVAN